MQIQKNRPPPPSGQVHEIHAVGLGTRKRHGEVAEAAFLAKASSLGFGVAKPWGDSERYDFILDSGHAFWRIQVKSTGRNFDSRYRVRAAGFNARYTCDEIDFLVAFIIPENLWYVVPVAALASRIALSFYPSGKSMGRLEKYREAWCQLACPRDEDGPSQILVERRCEGGSSAFGVCSLCQTAPSPR